jgi:glycine cleavage system transcriptional repressor
VRKIIVSVLGLDRPGIIAAVSEVLFRNKYNLEDVSQTILQTEFAGVFIASRPDSPEIGELGHRLREKIAPMGLSFLLQEMETGEAWRFPESEPFVITAMGPDRPGLVSGITGLLARFDINISNLKAVFRGGDNPNENTMIYEVDIPVSVDKTSFREALYERGREMRLEVSLQHREIFEAIHRI